MRCVYVLKSGALAASLSGPKSQGISVIIDPGNLDLTNQEQARRNRPQICCGEYS